MKYDLIISIDPGLKGAIAFETKDSFEVEKIPVKKVKGKNKTDYKKLESILKQKTEGKETIVFLEKVQAWHSDVDENPGKRFQIQKMLANYESLLTVIDLFDFDLIEIPPRSWQKYLNFPNKGVSKTERKQLYKEYAQNNRPNLKVTLQTSDAICISKFAKAHVAYHKNWVENAVAKRKV